MNVPIVIALCFAPFLLCFLLFRFAFRLRLSTELAAGLLGLLAVLPIAFMQLFLEQSVFQDGMIVGGISGTLFLRALFFNGLIEEAVKVVFLFFIPSKRLSFREFFLAGLLFGICLGSFESAAYFLTHLQQANGRGAELLYHLIFVRMASSDVIHACCAGLGAVFVRAVRSRKAYVAPLVFAVLIHGIFDFFAGFDGILRWFSAGAVLLGILECRICFMKWQENERPAPERKEAAPQAAGPAESVSAGRTPHA
ncbi:MAG: PrsW family intramembrane metalloprotease [Treponemataceae bacterium]|nr:PrsW family intramembrane metalloprotease [Treponemataceae bacterium]